MRILHRTNSSFSRCHLAFASKRLGDNARSATRGLRGDSFRSAKGRATSTHIQRVGGHTRGQPCTVEAAIACICPFALRWLGCERVGCGARQCLESHCIFARFLSSSDGRSVGLRICWWVLIGEVGDRTFGWRCDGE